MLHDLANDLRRLLAGGKGTDDALSELRASGASTVECIIAVKSLRGCDLAEAKEIVVLSSADLREQHDRLWDELEDAFKKIDDENA
jgi:ribosomal protein L7/L12